MNNIRIISSVSDCSYEHKHKDWFVFKTFSGIYWFYIQPDLFGNIDIIINTPYHPIEE